MKKKLFILVLLVMSLGLFTGCSSNSTSKSVINNQKASTPQKFRYIKTINPFQQSCVFDAIQALPNGDVVAAADVSNQSRLITIKPDDNTIIGPQLKFARYYINGDAVTSIGLLNNSTILLGNIDGQIIQWDGQGEPSIWKDSLPDTYPSIGGNIGIIAIKKFNDGKVLLACGDDRMFIVDSNGNYIWSYKKGTFSDSALCADGDIIGVNGENIYKINSLGQLQKVGSNPYGKQGICTVVALKNGSAIFCDEGGNIFSMTKDYTLKKLGTTSTLKKAETGVALNNNTAILVEKRYELNKPDNLIFCTQDKIEKMEDIQGTSGSVVTVTQRANGDIIFGTNSGELVVYGIR
ncbi:hypothetical protein [Desulfofundulus kuznetsovii]|uniref:hypothetical protein n=1 Tax=Desulfofundulus kuznetsovii TaxID=58135 RepID=UPI0002E26B66